MRTEILNRILERIESIENQLEEVKYLILIAASDDEILTGNTHSCPQTDWVRKRCVDDLFVPILLSVFLDSSLLSGGMYHVLL